jgi:hypothetical protein
MSALVEFYLLHGNPWAISPSYCFTCGGDPCILPSFCEACRQADFRNYRAVSQADRLKAFAEHARELASQWQAGLIAKADAVERAHNFAVAAGLLLFDGPNLEQAEASYAAAVETVQHILTAAFESSQ